MEIRPATLADIDSLIEIDGTMESTHYLHVDQAGEGATVSWRLEERALRSTQVTSNRIDDDNRFFLRQVLSGADEGVALAVVRDNTPVALLLAGQIHERNTLRVVDLRVDSDYRRQGIATALLLMLIGEARNRQVRAVNMETRADNAPMYHLLPRCGFELAGLDTRRHSNHDLVKESATLLWYASLD
jgi:ribosomal protein S18 acetylase RimI-like enzyme